MDENTEKPETKAARPWLVPPWTSADGPNPPPKSPGRPKLSEEEKGARQAMRHEIVRYQQYRSMTIEELKAIDQKILPVSDVLMIRKIVDDVRKLSTEETHRMYARNLGAPKQEIEGPSGIDMSKSKVTIKITAAPQKDAEDGG